MFGQDDPVPHPTPTFSDVQLVCRSPWYLPPPPERAAASGQRHMLWSKVRGSTPNCFSGCWWCICSCGAQKKRSCTTVDWPISSCITTDWLTTAVVTQWATWLQSSAHTTLPLTAEFMHGDGLPRSLPLSDLQQILYTNQYCQRCSVNYAALIVPCTIKIYKWRYVSGKWQLFRCWSCCIYFSPGSFL